MPIVHHMTAEGFGAHIGKYAERLKVTLKGEVQQQAPLMHLQTVTIVGPGVSISADAIAACCERGIPVYLLDGLGDVYATIYAAGIMAQVLTRREQLRAYDDERGMALIGQFGMAKMRNQARTLRYWARNRREAHPEQAALLAQTAHDIESDIHRMQTKQPSAEREALVAWLMGMEGAAARRYWQAARLIVPEEYGWPGRIGRGAQDPVNSLLNYGYGMLYAEVERAIVLAGLDPFAGFLHADRPGKPSLVLDLIEEFRQLVVDRTVIGLIARRYQVRQDDAGRLTPETRRDFAHKILHQLEGKARYNGQRHMVRHIIQQQARQVAAHIQRQGEYVSYLIEE